MNRLHGPESVGAPAEKAEIGQTLPRQLGGYELLGLIAEGGMGLVFRARHMSLNRVVALKMIRAGELAGSEEIRRFRFEAQAAAHLDHPNIVPVYEVGEHEGTHFFTMKLIEGGSLARWRGFPEAPGDSPLRCSLQEAGRILERSARAIHHAHQRGILHRDLKPSNILLNSEGEPMISDFGLARRQAGSDVTLHGTVLGTPAFMAPEQVSQFAGELTTASDVYALGAVLYFLLTGVPPFSGKTAYETMRQVMEDEPVRPSCLNGAVDRDLETVCLKCLENDPNRRYSSAGALADDLQRWLGHEPIQARASAVWERGLKWTRRRPAVAGLLAAGLLGAVAFLALLLAGDSKLRKQTAYALSQEKVAKEQARAAAEAAAVASLETQRAESNALSAQLQLYAADIFLAQNALDDGNYGLARQALKAHLPAPGKVDQRGFEWFYLWHRSQGDPAQVLGGHNQAVTTLCFSADGHWLVSGGRDGKANFWRADNHALEMTLPPPDLPDGLEVHTLMTPVFSASPEVAAILLTGRERYDRLMAMSRPGKPGDVRVVALSPDNRWLAVGSQWSYVRIWSVTQRELAWVVPAFSCRGLAFSPDGRWLVVGDAGQETAPESGWVKVYDLATHHAVQTVTSACGSFALSADGRTLALVRASRHVEVRDLASGEVRTEWAADVSGSRMALSPDGATLASVNTAQNEVVLWDTSNAKAVGRITPGNAKLWAMAFSPDGQALATAGADHCLRLWNTTTGRERLSLRGHGDEVLAVAFAPSGKQIVSAGRDQTIRVWDLPAPEAEKAAPHPPRLSCISASGQFGLKADDKGAIEVWDLAAARSHNLSDSSPQTILGFNVGGDEFATLSNGLETASVRFWRVSGEAEGEPVPLRSFPADWTVKGVAPAAHMMAFAPARGPISLFNWTNGTLLRQISFQKIQASQLLLSPDGQRLVVFQWPHFFQTFDTGTGRKLAAWRMHEGEMAAFAFSPDGQMLAAGGTDNQVTIWDPAHGGRLASLRGHKAEIKALAFSSDGRTLASSSASRTLKLWHVATWRELATLSKDRVYTSLTFTSGDNPSLLASEHGGELRSFSAPR